MLASTELTPTGARQRRNRAALRVVACSGWSLLLWGGWAFVANLPFGLRAAAQAATAQGLLSLTVTFVMTALLEVVSRSCRGAVAKLILPTAAAVAFHALATIGVHWAAGTPALAASVTPVILAGVVYSASYAAGLLLASHYDGQIPAPVARLLRRLQRREPGGSLTHRPERGADDPSSPRSMRGSVPPSEDGA